MSSIELPEGVNLDAIRDPAGFAAPKSTGRLNVIFNAYWQKGHEAAEDVPCRFGRGVSETQRPCRQEVVVDGDWAPVPTGWVERPGYLVLLNSSRIGGPPIEVFLMPHDPDEGRRDAFSDPIPKKAPTLVVFPGECQPLSPAPGVKVFVRSPGGAVGMTAVAVPA